MNLFFSVLVFLASLNWLDAQTRTITVAKDGSGSFTTVQDALNSVPFNNRKPILIFIKSGVYREKLHVDSTKDYIVLVGEDRFNTILVFDDHTGKVTASGDTVNTRNSASVVVKGNNFRAENITFQNDAGYTAGQAVGLELRGDQEIIHNCRIIGNQDILFTNNERGRSYFQNCYIEGTTDFIFGSETVWFDRCHIHSKKNSHITAASTPQQNDYGYVFNDCILTADSSLRSVSLGRPWRPYASVTYIHCYLGEHIKTDGWSNWNSTDYFKTARFAEFEDYGPGARHTGRVLWARELTPAEAKRITKDVVLRHWNPKLD